MLWIVSLGLLLLVLQSYQWLHQLHLGLPVALLAAMGLAVLSNSGVTWPRLLRAVGVNTQEPVLLATLEPPRQLVASPTAPFTLDAAPQETTPTPPS
jgi:hypothetical protein